jgi:hypothetical protein
MGISTALSPGMPPRWTPPFCSLKNRTAFRAVSRLNSVSASEPEAPYTITTGSKKTSPKGPERPWRFSPAGTAPLESDHSPAVPRVKLRALVRSAGARARPSITGTTSVAREIGPSARRRTFSVVTVTRAAETSMSASTRDGFPLAACCSTSTHALLL